MSEAEAILKVVHELHLIHLQLENGNDCCKSQSEPVTKHDLREMEHRIMSVISDYSARVQAAFSAIGGDVDTAIASLGGITTDVQNLKDLILKIQGSGGALSAEDQASLDASEVTISALQTKVSNFKTALAALDDSTANPPTV